MKTLFFTYVLASAAMATVYEYRLEKLLQEGNNRFSARMFSEVSNAKKGESYILSAYSVLTPLAQLALASVDESHDELLDTISMRNDSTTKEVFSLVDKKLRSINGITLKTASKIYIADNYELNEQFAIDTRDTFNSEVQNINFLASEEAAKEVNTWVEDQTNDRIKNLVDPSSFGENTEALLVNAIYFKIIEIPYEGNESSFVVVLPREIDGIDEVKEIFKNPTTLEDTLKDMWGREIELYLPKFKIETTTNLKHILMNMNVTRMFSPSTAKLNNLIKDTGGLYVSSATQKAFIEVNEEGAEAAAANEYEIRSTSAVLVPRTIEFKADHPFLFFLRGNDNTLFSGAYYS